MRGFALLPLLPLALAIPSPQGIDFLDFDAIDAEDVLPIVNAPIGATNSTPTYDADAAASSAAANAISDPVSNSTSDKRDDSTFGTCQKQPAGYGPISNPDTASNFVADPQFSALATQVQIPSGYVLSFMNYSGSTQQNAIGWTTLKKYDPYLCQEFCDAFDTACYAFNLYLERDPSIDPCTSNPNPKSTTNIKCVLYGAFVSPDTATNTGQFRGPQFQVAVAASNGYNKLAAPANQSGFDAPVSLGGAINAPDNSYIGMKFYSGPYNPAQCASACQATTTYNSQHPNKSGMYDSCNFFNSYVLAKNGVPQGTYCSFYTTAWSNQYAVNYGQYRGNDRYTVGQSYGWSLSS